MTFGFNSQYVYRKKVGKKLELVGDLDEVYTLKLGFINLFKKNLL